MSRVEASGVYSIWFLIWSAKQWRMSAPDCCGWRCLALALVYLWSPRHCSVLVYIVTTDNKCSLPISMTFISQWRCWWLSPTCGSVSTSDAETLLRSRRHRADNQVLRTTKDHHFQFPPLCLAVSVSFNFSCPHSVSLSRSLSTFGQSKFTVNCGTALSDHFPFS